MINANKIIRASFFLFIILLVFLTNLLDIQAKANVDKNLINELQNKPKAYVTVNLNQNFTDNIYSGDSQKFFELRKKHFLKEQEK